MHKTLPALLAAGVLAGLVLPARPADEAALLKPVNLTLNTSADEIDPNLASDGLTLYYACNAKGKFDIMVSERRRLAQVWPAGRLLEDYVATPADDRGPFATTEGRYPQYLYYATKRDKETTNFDLFVAVRQDRGKVYSAPTPLNTVDTEADETSPWLTADGRELYFSRKTAEGWRVFVVSRQRASSAAGFGEPKRVEELAPNFHHVTLTPDGRTMYLQGPLDPGRTGLFRSTKTREGWSKPAPLDRLNHPEGKTGDRCPSLGRDGRMLYFASDRPGGKGGLDLWVIPTALLNARK